MFARNLIDKFWREVSRAVDAPDKHISCSFSEKAANAFCDIIYFCENFDPDYSAGPCDLAFEFVTVINNDFNQTFNLEETLPPDILRQGIAIANIATKQYYA